MKILKICFFGIYNKDYSRNRILLKSFELNEIEVVECVTNKRGFIKYLDLILKFAKMKKDFDFVFVAFPGQQVCILAKILTRKKIIFDAFISLYDSLVEDRKIFKKNSIKANYYWFLDFLSLKFSDFIIVDTQSNLNYFVEKFKVARGKIFRVFLGSDAINFTDCQREKNNSNELNILFYGSFIPLQGVDIVIRVAELLKDKSNIKFLIIGSKIADFYKNKVSCKNIKFISNVNYCNLVKFINKTDICLGIFGDSKKSNRVIPNKVYDGACLGKIVITKSSKAISELFVNEKNIFTLKPDPKIIAEKIIKISKNKKNYFYLGDNAKDLFNKELKIKNLINNLLSFIY